MFKFETRGLNEVLQNLSRLGDQVDMVIEESLKKGAEEIKNEMIRLVPISRDNEHMKDNIQISNVQKGTSGEDYLQIGVFWEGSVPGIVIKAHLYYALILEFGSFKMRPRPFVRPAFQKKKKVCVEIMKDVMKRRLRL